MRVHPSALIAVLLAVIYSAIVAVLWWVIGVDSATIGGSTENVMSGIVIPIGVGAVYLLGAGWWMGWWRLALVDRTGYRERWMLLAPVLMVIAAIGNLLSGTVGSQELSYLLVLAAGVLLSASARSRSPVDWVWSAYGSACPNSAPGSSPVSSSA